jgi:hypothetical protein
LLIYTRDETPPPDLCPPAANAARSYRAALRHVHSAGLDWVVADQVEGAISYAGLDSDVVAYLAA